MCTREHISELVRRRVRQAAHTWLDLELDGYLDTTSSLGIDKRSQAMDLLEQFEEGLMDLGRADARPDLCSQLDARSL